VIVIGFLGALASLAPIFFVHNINAVALCLTSALFFSELIIGPIWSVPMDIAPNRDRALARSGRDDGAHVDGLRAAAPATRRIGAICTGAFVLAEAGLLRGRRATTHWMSARELARRFPDTLVDDDRIFVADQGIWTSAGMTAGLDLALAMVEEDLGRELARSVARAMVLYHRRSGGQSQHSALLELEPKSDRIQSALTYAKSNLKNALTLDELAEAARLSSRQFSRAFREETGQTPAKAVERLRVEAARLMLEEGRHTVETVAYEIGFGDRERMRRAFLRNFGLPPQAVRRTAQL